MDQPASLIAMVQEVRERLIKAQQAVADRYDIVADGRDCGSVVFPDAEFKFYLTASIEARAARLLHDADRKAQGLTVQEAIDEIHERDERDMSRKVAPLATPNGAIIIDNSDLDFDQTVARLEYFIKPH